MNRRSTIISRQPACLAVVTAVLLSTAADAQAGLTEASRLAAIYELILDARFERVGAELQRACPPAPSEACHALLGVSLYWQILLDPDNRQLDSQFNDRAAAAIGASDAWTKREPQRAEAWFYLAGSYAPLVQWRVLRGQRLSAAREGRKAKDALERALQLDPMLDDAYFGIGLYHYYADVVPAAAKILRFLLLLPGGDRVQGLREMLQARQKGILLKGEADYQLHLIYLWYEHKTAQAIELLNDLDARYAYNPLFLQRRAEAQSKYVHDSSASASTWQVLLERARTGRVYDARRVEDRARRELAALERTSTESRN